MKWKVVIVDRLGFNFTICDASGRNHKTFMAPSYFLADIEVGDWIDLPT